MVTWWWLGGQMMVVGSSGGWLVKEMVNVVKERVSETLGGVRVRESRALGLRRG